MHLVVLALKLLQPRVEVRADAGEDVAQVRQHGLGEERYLVTKTKWACIGKRHNVFRAAIRLARS